MSKRYMNGADFTEMLVSAASLLQSKVADINALNVFPVPDGDTGTNMNLTLSSGVEELRKKPSEHLGKSAEVLAKGLLMGARGNSGVILSQLFRGFAKAVQGFEQIDTAQFAAALQSGVDTAYQAVVKPVEGTILTVSKEAAKHAVQAARKTSDMNIFLTEIVHHAKAALARTPDLLPILRQVGVVDSGGQGLVFIYEGFLAAIQSPDNRITNDAFDLEQTKRETPASPAIAGSTARSMKAQAQLATEDIEFLYDLEFFILLPSDDLPLKRYDETYFRKQLEADGDSIILIEDNGIVKVHVHSKSPGEVLNQALLYGELSRINIQNMRDQHRDLLAPQTQVHALPDETFSTNRAVKPYKPYGIISVAAGNGLHDIFVSLGVDCVVSGGQTMNPSTEDIVKSIENVKAETVFILPNNSNIIMAAKQAAELAVGKNIIVIPTKTVPQGISAVIAFQEDASEERNRQLMTESVRRVRSGQITFAVRDSTIDGINIRENDYIGMLENEIASTDPNIVETAQKLLQRMVSEEDEVIAIFTGIDAKEEHTARLVEFIGRKFPDVETEVHYGGQPLYYYIFSVE